MDDDPVLRALGAALEHDDPRLAALLRAGPARAGPARAVGPVRRIHPDRRGGRAAEPPRAPRARRLPRPPGWCLLLAGVLAPGVVLLAAVRLGPAALGVVSLILVIASPIAASRCCASADELRPAEPEDPPPGPPSCGS